jgi:hypothetical protein
MPQLTCGTLERRWGRPTVLARVSRTTGGAGGTQGSASVASSTLTAEQLSATVDAILAELGKTARLKGLRLEVEWADALMHFDVVAGDFAGDSDRQLQTVASACVAELLGDAAQAYEIRWQLQSDGHHLLIGAVQRGHLQALADAAMRHGLKLGSVQPDFCGQWNRHASALKPGAAVFTVASEREAMIACVVDGAIATMSSGAWIDASDPVPAPDVRRLMSGFGLDVAPETSLLDKRVDRLLASIGRDPAHESAYILVAPELSDTEVSSRWTVVNRETSVA